MKAPRLLTDRRSLADAFAQCCKKFDSVHLAVAWCGDPAQVLPFRYLEGFEGDIRVTVGVAFNNTHPDALEWFGRRKVDLRVFKDSEGLFHPKLFLFTSGDRYALLLGSSNFTYGGFFSNVEANCLIEGSLTDGSGRDIRRLQGQLGLWHSPEYSFVPEPDWIASYRKEHMRSKRAAKKNRVKTPPRAEDVLGTASWLRDGDWSLFFDKVVEGLQHSGRTADEYHRVLDAASTRVPVPWRASYFRDIERRRIIGGYRPYGWLGHVGASGSFRHLLAEGDRESQRTVVRGVNAVARLVAPIGWKKLENILDELVGLGPTMKVWGRLLCIVRPDLYCTVSSYAVRANLSAVLSVPQNSFETPEGYLRLLRLVHDSPWFNSSRPAGKAEAAIWDRRVAFIDAIFYDE